MSPRSSLCLWGAIAALGLGLSACGSSGPLTPGSAIGSDAQRSALDHTFAAATEIPQKDRTPIVNCLITALGAHGITTHGAFAKHSNQALTKRLTARCTETVLGGITPAARKKSFTGTVASGY
jgi:hypothetical protein